MGIIPNGSVLGYGEDPSRMGLDWGKNTHYVLGGTGGIDHSRSWGNIIHKV